MVKTKNTSIWMLNDIANLLHCSPIHRLNALQCLGVEQKKSNPIEAGMCCLHQAAIICEVMRLAPIPGTPSSMPESAALLSSILKIDALSNESFISDWSLRSCDVALKAPEKNEFTIDSDLSLDFHTHQRDKRFSLEGLENALMHAEKCFTAGKISELSSMCLRLLMKFAEDDLAKMRDLSLTLQQAQENALDQHNKYGQERFGSFFRVKFYGERFPEEMANHEFVIREGMAAKLSEVSEKVKAEAELLTEVPVTILKTATAPSPNDMKNMPALHLTFVKIFNYDWQHDDIIEKLNSKYFTYSTPFTSAGSAHGSIKTQKQRKTFLKVKYKLPSVIGKNSIIICISYIDFSAKSGH